MKNKQSGQILLLVIVVIGLVLVNSLLIAGGAMIFSQNSHYSLYSTQALNLAEAGVDKAVSSFNSSGGNYTGDPEINLGTGTLSIEVTDLDSRTKSIKATSYVPSKINPQSKKVISFKVSKGTGTSFNYGMQVGEGGLYIGNGPTLNGSIYSNGNIIGGNLTRFTGDVWVAGGVQPAADQESDCQDLSCQDYIFGKNVNGENRASVAQSFKPSTSLIINKAALKLKKIGSPANLTVRILSDDNGKPNEDNILCQGTLSSSLVTNQYGFTEVAFTSTPLLQTNTSYWILISSTINDNNYWSWSKDSLQGYSRGSAYWSTNWQDNKAPWTFITGDLGFKTYMGGVATRLDLGSGSQVDGDVHANTIKNTLILKDAYYQLLADSTVRGTSYPGSADPPPAVFPISEANITSWKNQAEEAGIFTGDKNFSNDCNTTLSSGKIIGNVTLGNNCIVTVQTPIWITGNITTGNSARFKLDSSYGSTSGMIMADGVMSFSNGFDAQGSGTLGSYIMLISLYDSRQNGTLAVTSGNSSFSGILYAPFGIIDLANGAQFKEITAWKINLGNGTILSYESGLSSIFFTSGPSGAYSLIKGTYQIQ